MILRNIYTSRRFEPINDLSVESQFFFREFNNDGNGNGNVAKTKGLMSKPMAVHVL